MNNWFHDIKQILLYKFLSANFPSQKILFCGQPSLLNANFFSEYPTSLVKINFFRVPEEKKGSREKLRCFSEKSQKVWRLILWTENFVAQLIIVAAR